MKVAITASADSLQADMDDRFGRCPFFCIVDTEKSEEVVFVGNQGAKQGHGAGIKAAQQIADAKVGSVITGNVGPNALAVLKQFEIAVFQFCGSIEEAIAAYVKGELGQLNEPVQAHHGKR